MYLDEIRLSSLTYFDRMQFCEMHIKGLCSMGDKAYRRFYRIFTAHLVKVNFGIFSMMKPHFLLDVTGRNEYSAITPYALYSLALSTFLWVFLLEPCPTNTKSLSCKILRYVAIRN